jgi:hypothetical protein
MEAGPVLAIEGVVGDPTGIHSGSWAFVAVSDNNKIKESVKNLILFSWSILLISEVIEIATSGRFGTKVKNRKFIEMKTTR